MSKLNISDLLNTISSSAVNNNINDLNNNSALNNKNNINNANNNIKASKATQ